jgi:hypothetical protein
MKNQKTRVIANETKYSAAIQKIHGLPRGDAPRDLIYLHEIKHQRVQVQ